MFAASIPPNAQMSMRIPLNTIFVNTCMPELRIFLVALGIREYLAPQIRSMNNRFHSEAKYLGHTTTL